MMLLPRSAIEIIRSSFIRSSIQAKLNLPPQVQPHADHGAPRVYEDGRLAECRRAEQGVLPHGFFGRVVEQVEHVEDHIDAPRASKSERSRHAQIEQRLRRHPPRPTRLEQNAAAPPAP